MTVAWAACPVTVPKFTGADPMILAPVNSRLANVANELPKRSSATAALLPATIELVSVVRPLLPSL